MRCCCAVILVLSSCAWAGKVVVTISPIVPGFCAVFVASVQVNAVLRNGTIARIGGLRGVDLAPLQLTQVPVGTRVLPNNSLRTFQVKISNPVCVDSSGAKSFFVAPAPFSATGKFPVPSSPTTFLLLLDLAAAHNSLVPHAQRLNMAKLLDSPPSPAGLHGLVVGKSSKGITILTQ